MSKRKQIRALHEALSEAVVAASDEELIDEVRERGQDPAALAEDTRSRLLQTIKTFQQRPLVRAREERARSIQKIESMKPDLPTSPEARRAFLVGVLAQKPNARGVLTAQWRDLEEMTDDDVETALMELSHLGFVEPGKGV
jgi:hypothetical protein